MGTKGRNQKPTRSAHAKPSAKRGSARLSRTTITRLGIGAVAAAALLGVVLLTLSGQDDASTPRAASDSRPASTLTPASAPPQDGSLGPKLAVASDTIDLGTIGQTETVEDSIEISNVGDDTLIIEDVKSS